MRLSAAPHLNEQHWIWSLWGVAGIAIVYCLIHSLIRLAVSGTIGQDDVAANILAQSFEWGYIVRQGPLYDMLLSVVQKLTGPTIFSFHLLKYGSLLFTICFIYLSAWHIFRSSLWAALTALSLSLFYQIGWNIHEGVTHTLVLMVSITGAFWAFLHVCRYGQITDYILFGLFLGLGFLSKHTFGIFVVLLFLSAVMQSSMRKRLFHPFILISVLVACLVMTPYLLWLSERLMDLQSEAQQATGVSQMSYLERLVKGLPNILMGPLGFCFPLIVILPLVFPSYVFALKNYIQSRLQKKPEPDFEKLLLFMLAGAFVILLIALFGFGIWRFAERYMHPFFLTSLISFIAIAKYTNPDIRQIRRFLTVMLIVASGILFMRIGILWVQDPFCKPCRQNIPFAGLGEAIRNEGFRQGVIIAGYRHEGGNLRQLFPGSLIISVENPSYVPPMFSKLDHQKQDVIAVWSAERQEEGVPHQIVKELEKMGVKTLPSVKVLEVPWTHLWRPKGYRMSKWHMVFVRTASRIQK